MTEAPSGNPNRPVREISTANFEEHHGMPTTAPIQAAIYVKEAAGYPDGENSKELQTSECEDFCIAQEFEISTRYYDPPGSRHQFEWMMGDATEENQPSLWSGNSGISRGPSTRQCYVGTGVSSASKSPFLPSRTATEIRTIECTCAAPRSSTGFCQSGPHSN